MEPEYIYAHQGKGLTRIGLRETNLTSQLENKKKYKNKTQSIMMLNSNFSRSKGHLADNMSVKSGNSTDMLQNVLEQGSMVSGMNNYQAPHYQHQHQQQHQQPPNMYNQYPQQQGYPPQQGYAHYQQQQYQQNYQQQQQQYPTGQQYPAHHQQISIPKQRQNKNFRESYMYLNGNGSTHDASSSLLNRVSASPEMLQRRFSSQNGGTGIGSPMKFSNEEQARKISLNALIGASGDDGINDTINYMNHLDGLGQEMNEEDWISIDEEVEQSPTYNGIKKVSEKDSDKMIQRLQMENRSLKKKLKDIELGHDSNSIVANDESYTRLESDYKELAQNFEIIQSETKNLIVQNDAYFKDITRLKGELDESDDMKDTLVGVLKNIIDSAPSYFKDKLHFKKVLGSVESVKNIPVAITDAYMQNLNVYDRQDLTSSIDTSMTNDDITKMLKLEILSLYESNKSLKLDLKKIDKLFSRKLSDERKTIIVSTLQKSLNNEFLQTHPDFKVKRFNRFKVVDIVSAATQDEELDVGDDTMNSNATITDLKNPIISHTIDSPNSIPTISPITPVSQNSMNSLNSIIDKRSSYSSTTTEEGSEDQDFHSTKSISNSNSDIISKPKSHTLKIDSPLDIQYETFTA